MKKLMIMAFMLIGLSISAFAQNWGLGVNLGYGNDVSKPSLGLKALYDISETFTIAPSLNIYLPKTESKLEQLKKLDKSAERPGTIVAIILGVVGSLVMGTGMCCTMVWNTSLVVFIVGIVVGIIGMAMVGIAYPVYVRITKKQRAKIADKIIDLSNEI